MKLCIYIFGFLFLLVITGCESLPSQKSDNVSDEEIKESYPDGFLIGDSADCRANKCMIVTVANIGQGNSTIIRLPNEQSMLIDAGTSARPSGGDNAKAKDNLLSAIENMEITPTNPFDYVVLSHPDKDHVSLVDKLLDKELINIGQSTTLHISGLPKAYASTNKAHKFFNKIYRQWPTAPADCNSSGFKNKDAKLTVVCYNQAGIVNNNPIYKNWPTDSQQKLWTTYPLAVNQGANPNANSIVVGLSMLNEIIAIIPGDATEVTTQSIQTGSNPSLYNRPALYVLAHHGADTHGSNSYNWLRALEAKVYVASNSRYGTWQHPSNTITKLLLEKQSRTLLNSDPHTLFQAAKKTQDISFCVMKNMKKAIFSTFSNGFLRLEFELGQRGSRSIYVESSNQTPVDKNTGKPYPTCKT